MNGFKLESPDLNIVKNKINPLVPDADELKFIKELRSLAKRSIHWQVRVPPAVAGGFLGKLRLPVELALATETEETSLFYDVGLEYSSVLYFRVQRSKISEPELTARLKKISEKNKCDEFNLVPASFPESITWTYRFWWD